VSEDGIAPVTKIVEWFFGRGLSIGCGLRWTVPLDWRQLPRQEQIARIRKTLQAEMQDPRVDCRDIRTFLDQLANRTTASWAHQFHTTNWDYLLQREILALGHTVQPRWCAETHVYHLNGTIEDLSDNSRRSEFVLETDTANARTVTVEGDIAFNKFIWGQVFVVVGMSFECEVDKYLLAVLRKVQDDLPIGQSFWIVLDPDPVAVSSACHRLASALPRATIIDRTMTFNCWLAEGMPELQRIGALRA
jgi:hypothetical protein